MVFAYNKTTYFFYLSVTFSALFTDKYLLPCLDITSFHSEKPFTSTIQTHKTICTDSMQSHLSISCFPPLQYSSTCVNCILSVLTMSNNPAACCQSLLHTQSHTASRHQETTKDNYCLESWYFFFSFFLFFYDMWGKAAICCNSKWLLEIKPT